jgi:hypothetical protein
VGNGPTAQYFVNATVEAVAPDLPLADLAFAVLAPSGAVLTGGVRAVNVVEPGGCFLGSYGLAAHA